MLDKAHRITSGDDYRLVVRRGRRSVGGSTVSYIHKNPNGGPPRFGFIVAKTVGNAVTRNRVRRRLKAICLDLVRTHGSALHGTDVVIRALPAAAAASFADLGRELSRAAGKAVAS